MGVFADELRGGIGEAARKMIQARVVGDHFSAETYLERLRYLQRVAARQGVEAPPEFADPGEDPR